LIPSSHLLNLINAIMATTDIKKKGFILDLPLST